MNLKPYLFAFWALLCSNLIAQTNGSKSIKQPVIVYLDSIPNGGKCTKTSQHIRLIDPETNGPSEFSIVRIELYIHSSQKNYSTLSGIISGEMKQALESLKSGENILFRITAINSKRKTIMATGSFTIK